MVRHRKYGLDFYYKPTNEFDDIKIRRLNKRYKHLGYAVYNALLTLIYQNGQFYKFDSIEDLSFIISENIYSDERETTEVINFIIEIDLFDQELFKEGYITSLNIQENYLHATRRRIVRLLDEALLIPKDKLKNLKLVYLNGISVYVNATSVYANDENVDAKQHSNSHSQSNSNKDDKLMIEDFSLDEASVPFKIHYYLKILLEHEIIDITNPIAKELNDYFNDIDNVYHNDDLTKAVRYTASYIKKTGWIDSNKHKIINKKDYLIKTIEVNTIKNQRNRDGSKEIEYQKLLKEIKSKYGD